MLAQAVAKQPAPTQAAAPPPAVAAGAGRSGQGVQGKGYSGPYGKGYGKGNNGYKGYGKSYSKGNNGYGKGSGYWPKWAPYYYQHRAPVLAPLEFEYEGESPTGETWVPLSEMINRPLCGLCLF